MDDSTVWLLISPLLSDAELEKLSHTPVWNAISPIVSGAWFWHLRCELALNHPLPVRQLSIEAWKKSYGLLVSYAHQLGAFFFCVQDVNTVQILLDTGRDPTACNNRALRRACESGYTDTVKLLLSDERIDPECTPGLLSLACKNGHVGVVVTLLEDERIDPRPDGPDLLHTTISWNRPEMLRVIIEDRRIAPSHDGWLFYALRRAGVGMECIQVLFDSKLVDAAEIGACLHILRVRHDNRDWKPIVRLLETQLSEHSYER